MNLYTVIYCYSPGVGGFDICEDSPGINSAIFLDLLYKVDFVVMRCAPQARLRLRCTNSKEMAAGVMPEMRAA